MGPAAANSVNGGSSDRNPLSLASGAALAVAVVGSVILLPALGYDAWAWMVWARELATFSLDTSGGPSFKPLPVIVAAPLAPLGDAAPFAWLVLVRASFVGSVWIAWLIGRELAGTAAGIIAAAGICLIGILASTAIYGSSEPVLVAALLGAVLAWLRERASITLVLLATCTLIRPEACVLLIPMAAVAWREISARRSLIACALLLPPVLWLGLDWAGSGNSLNSAHVAQGDTPGNAGHAAVPGLELLSRAADSVILPVLAGFAIGLVLSWRRRDSQTLTIAAAALAWLAVVAVATQAGFSGANRYVIGPVALACVVAGVGWGRALALCPGGPVRWAASACLGVVIVVCAWPTIRTDARTASVARENARQQDQLSDAAGTLTSRQLGSKPVIVNPWMQSALAWRLDRPLHKVIGVWSSTGSEQGWKPPVVLFIGPPRFAGPRPELPTMITGIGRLTGRGSWSVVELR